MKKLLFILIMLVCSVAVQAQQDSIQYVTDSNVEKLVDKYSAKIEASIVALAQQLKQPAEYVYKLIIKQQFIIGITWLVGLIVGLILTIVGIYMSIKYGDYENDFLEVIGIISIIIGLILFTACFVGFLIEGLPCLLNPEYMALREIIRMIK